MSNGNTNSRLSDQATQFLNAELAQLETVLLTGRSLDQLLSSHYAMSSAIFEIISSMNAQMRGDTLKYYEHMNTSLKIATEALDLTNQFVETLAASPKRQAP